MENSKQRKSSSTDEYEFGNDELPCLTPSNLLCQKNGRIFAKPLF